MSVFMVFAFLGLFSFNQALRNCEELTKPRTIEYDNKSILGKWFFLKGIADHHLFTNILKTVNSSWIKFGPSFAENTVTLSQGNMLNGKCEFTTINTTIKYNILNSNENGTISEGRFLSSCPDCLTISFISQYQNERIKSLYFFKRESKPDEMDMKLYWEQAACFGFKTEDQYTYDGVTELCHDAKNNSTETEKPLSLDQSDQ